MKTQNTKNHKFLMNSKLSLLLIFICFIINSVHAQEEQEKWKIKGKESKFIVYGTKKDKGVKKINSLINAKFDYDKLRENRTPVELSEFSLYRINSHEIFLNAFKNAFSEERIEELTLNDEYIDVGFLLDENGTILSIDYMLYSNSTITAFELEKLEKELLKSITFKTVTLIKPNSYGLFTVKTTFKQIMEGEIRAIRANEEATKEYFK